MNVYLIRHGETDWNVVGRLQGREDIPLNDNGKLQAERCALALSNRKWKAVFTSPLLRARQTADIMAEILKIQEVHEDYDLIERDYGKASGLIKSEREQLFPDGKYEGIEDWEVLHTRVCGAVIRCADKFYPDDVIIISHGNAINSVLAGLSGHAIGTGKTRLKNTCVNMLTYDGKSLEVEFFNKTYDEL